MLRWYALCGCAGSQSGVLGCISSADVGGLPAFSHRTLTIANDKKKPIQKHCKHKPPMGPPSKGTPPSEGEVVA